jgi:sarcosine oxidase subunit beta
VTTRDFAVVGGGVIGAAIAHHLTALGASVAVVEQHGLAAGSATHGSAGQVRLHNSDPAEARLAALAFGAFRDWSGDIGFRRTGFAFLVDRERTGLLDDNVKVLKQYAIPTTVLSPEQFASAHPGIDLAGVAAVAYEPDSGYADPTATARAYLDRARRAGALVRTTAGGARLRQSGGRVVGVDTGTETISAGQVVLAAGVWSGRILAESGPRPDLPIRARRVGLVITAAGGQPWRARLPMVIDDVNGVYFRPHLEDELLFGVPLHSWDVPLEKAGEPPSADRENAARALVGRRLPGLGRAGSRFRVAAADGYTPDRRALIGPVPGRPGLYLATAFNGGGFKVAPAVGQGVAAELTGAGERPELLPYRPERFLNDAAPSPQPARYLTM